MRHAHFLFALLLSLPGLLPAQETIHRFDARLEVRPDGGARMHETVEVTASGKIIKRGITRAVTRRPIGPGLSGRFNYRPESVRRDGVDIEYFDETTADLHTFYLGSKNKKLKAGRYVYDFTYAAPGQLYHLDTLDEIRWHLIDTEGSLPVENASMDIVFPEGLDVTQAACYAGAAGSRERACQVSVRANVATFTLTRPLAAGEGMTVAAGVPTGFFPTDAGVRIPSAVENAPGSDAEINGIAGGGAFSSGIPAGFAGMGSTAREPVNYSYWQIWGTRYALLFGFGLAFIYAYRSWDVHGRDPVVNSAKYVYHPPEGLSPAGAGYQRSLMNADRALPAALTALAIRGLVNISEEDKKGLLNAGEKHFVIRKTDQTPTGDLPPEEALLYEELFKSSETVALDGKYDSGLARTQRAFNKLVRREYGEYHRDGANYRLYWPMLIILLATLAVAGVLLIGAPKVNAVLFAVGIVVALIVFAAYAYFIAQPSRENVAHGNYLKALRNYLKLSREKRDRLPNAPEMTEDYYQSLLPYAIALGADNDWAADLATDWANTSASRSRRHNHVNYAVLYGAGFGNSLRSGFHGTATQASSGGSGGGFSGGGGSVGGGGGGTGGF